MCFEPNKGAKLAGWCLHRFQNTLSLLQGNRSIIVKSGQAARSGDVISMSMPAESLNMTVEDYLRTEELSDVRREFVDGQIYAMVGASNAHNVIALNLATLLRQHVRGSGCRAYISDMKVQIKTTNCFYYPDVMVTCESFDPKSFYNTAPVFICEVLSPSTAEIDRREKLVAYKQLPSLRDYLVVHQEQQQVELYTKTLADKWNMTVFRGAEQLMLKSLPSGQLSFPVSALYEDVFLDPQRLTDT